MSPNYIKLHMDGLYTQRSFQRVQEHTNRSSDEKVMAFQSWRPHMNSDLRKMRISGSLNAIQIAPTKTKTTPKWKINPSRKVPYLLKCEQLPKEVLRTLPEPEAFDSPNLLHETLAKLGVSGIYT